MSRKSFIDFALDCGLQAARDIAKALGIPRSKVDTWEAAIPAFRQVHHY